MAEPLRVVIDTSDTGKPIKVAQFSEKPTEKEATGYDSVVYPGKLPVIEGENSEWPPEFNKSYANRG